MSPTIAIILVNYNGFEDTYECVQSILKSTYSNFKIFCVDNASTITPDKSILHFIKKNTTYIQSQKNLGFSGGNNLAIQLVLEEDFDYILLLNNDTTVDSLFLKELVNCYETSENRNFIATGKIYYYSKPSVVWSAGGEYNRLTGITTQYGGDDESFNKDQDITFATGCLMMIPRDVACKVGLLSEDYFLYSEDTDYCQRAIDLGFTLKYCSKCHIYHKVSASVGNSSYQQDYYMSRNNYFMIKKFSKCKWITYVIFSLHLFKEIFRGRSHLNPVILGIKDFIKGKKGKL